jgi:transcription antitermination factor NusG
MEVTDMAKQIKKGDMVELTDGLYKYHVGEVIEVVVDMVRLKLTVGERTREYATELRNVTPASGYVS